MKNITKKAVIIGIIAGILVLIDGVIARLLNQSGSFTWIAFVSWTVFFGATMKERLEAIPGYVIGFFAGFVIMQLGGTLLSFISLRIFGVAIVSILVTILINFLCIELEGVKKFFPISVSGIFVGIAMTFSGLGIGLTPDNLQNAILMLAIIVIYGILGLLSGWATLKFNPEE